MFVKFFALLGVAVVPQ